MTTLQVANGDIVLENGTPVIDTGMNAVMDHLQNVIKLQLGDWINDPADGIDWNNILGSGLSGKQIAQIIQTRILADGIVTNITDITVNFDDAGRVVSVGLTIDGTTLTVPI